MCRAALEEWEMGWARDADGMRRPRIDGCLSPSTIEGGRNLLMVRLSTFYVECRNVFKLNIVDFLRTIKLEAPKVQGIIKSINYITPSTADMEYFYSHLLAAERYCLP
ncbi:hypothetical protein ALC56_12681 [Trachymyrmex septentrionalis]|uniref:Uncharacterized protein n=1 Tax=Trachymyrmex septentrionalis TaxID=34720 RepID=A0A195EYR2_9HYME|nr:hypothetical protein ALC56_12681 [Trachymyrmex septentrionalis]